MKFAILSTSVLVLSATLMSGTSFAQYQQQGNPATQPGAKSCVIQGKQVFSCHYKRVYHKLIPPTFRIPFDPVDLRRYGNEGGGGNNEGDRGGNGGNNGNNGKGGTGARP